MGRGLGDAGWEQQDGHVAVQLCHSGGSHLPLWSEGGPLERKVPQGCGREPQATHLGGEGSNRIGAFARVSSPDQANPETLSPHISRPGRSFLVETS